MPSSNRCRVGQPTKNLQSSSVATRKNSVGKFTLQRHDARDYDTSFGDGVWRSIKTSITLSFIVSIFIVLLSGKTDGLNTLAYFSGIFFIITLFSGIITLIFTFSIAYPMTIILRYLNLLNDINMALVGGVCTFLTMMLIPRNGFVSFHYVVVFWGLACGYAFIHGYYKG